MDRKIRVGAVSYLNTKPLIYGFERWMMKDEIDLVIDYPAKIATALLNDEIDIGLVPVAILPEMNKYYFISDYCIGCNGEVASVCLFSEVPLSEIQTVLLDYQSRTSVVLAKILMKEFWKISPEFKETKDGFRSEIKGNTAAVIIGDRALEQRKRSKYVYDLGTAWKEYTGLPFLFAAWVSNKPMSEEFIKNFDKANAAGFLNIEEVIRANPFNSFDLKNYYTDFISYSFTNDKMEALQLFLEKLSTKVFF